MTPAVATLRDERHAAKEMQRATGCSASQALRILYTGRVPRELRAGFVEVLKRFRDHARSRADAYDRFIEAIEHEEMVGRAAARRVEGRGASR